MSSKELYEAHADYERCLQRVLEPSVKNNPRVLGVAKYFMAQKRKQLVALTDDEFGLGDVMITRILADGVSHGDADHFFTSVSDQWERENC